MSHSRKLAVIMFTDIVSFTKLMGTDEDKALEALEINRKLQKPIIECHNGQLVKEIGDGILASFTTATDALKAAINIQNACINAKYFQIKIALHLGELVFKNKDVYGDGVNVASRIETLGVGSSILMSKIFRDQVKNKTEFILKSIGTFNFKNVDGPVEIFALSNPGFVVPERKALQGKLEKKIPKSSFKTPKDIFLSKEDVELEKTFKQKNKHRLFKEFSETILSNEFIEWQNQIIEKIYGSQNLIEISNSTFPVHCYFPHPDIANHPFDKLCPIYSLILRHEFDKTIPTKPQTEYWELVKDNFEYNGYGYALNYLILDEENRITSLSAKSCRYFENVLTSDFLQYELYEIFKNKSLRKLALNLNKFQLLEYFPERQKIHSNQTQHDILTKGINRVAQLGVQALVAYKVQNEYKVKMIKRGGPIILRPGYFQFIPSGQFEIWEKNPTEIEFKKNYTPYYSIMREILEEVFGIKKFQRDKDGQSVESIIKNHDITKKLEKLIFENKAFFEFIGSDIDLTILRHELCFMLVIDEPDTFLQKLFAGKTTEGDTRDYSISDIISIFSSSKEKINPGSAGLFKLAKECRLFNKIK